MDSIRNGEEIRILVADDSPFIRTAYRRILKTQDSFDVVAVAEDGVEAVEKAIELKPDVIVMDVRMPRLDGISASHKIRETAPETSVIVVSAYDDWSYVFDLLQKDPKGKAYLVKSSLDDIGELIRVVELVNQGDFVLDHALASKLPEYHERHSGEGEIQLDSSEVSVLSVLAEGYTDEEIGSILQMDTGDVNTSLGSAYEKLGINPGGDVNIQALATEGFLNLSVSE